LNAILILKELWRRRLLVVLSAFLAAAIAVLAVFQVSVSPPGISKRAKVEARGTISILIDSARSPIADARRDVGGLSERAGVFARLMAGGNVVGQIADETGIPVKQIDVAGPTPLPGEAPGAGQLPQLHPYGIAISQSGELPIVGVETRAPTVKEALALAAAAPGAVRRVVTSIQAQQDTPATRRVEFRVLGPAQAGIVDDALGKKIAMALFVVVFLLCIFLILAVPRFRAAWRSADPDAALAQPEQGDAPDVVPLRAGGNDQPVVDESDSTATWIGQRREP
jgi:hypothetical protein